MNRPTRHGGAIFVGALVLRVLATIPAALKITPYSQDDPESFAAAAAFIATAISEGGFALPPVSYTTRVWGLFLSPFWLLPGPSAEYARLLNALLGALAVYNVYVIAAEYRSTTAGIAASVPMAVYPTHALLHGTLMREAPIVLGLTLVARLYVSPPPSLSRWSKTLLAGATLLLMTVLRPDNTVIYLVVIATGAVLYLVEKRDGSDVPLSPTGTTVLAGLIGGFSIPLLRGGLRRLAGIRRHRAEDNAVYLADVAPEQILPAIATAWILAMYFLYAPFPWMISSGGDMIASLEGIVTIVYTIAAITGIRFAARRQPRTALPLLVGFVVGIGLYSLGTANYGAATRFRQMFTWLLFVFGGIGFPGLVQISWKSESDSNNRS